MPSTGSPNRAGRHGGGAGGEERAFRISQLSGRPGSHPIAWDIMNDRLGLCSLVMALGAFAARLSGHSIPAGVLALCAGTLGYLAGRRNG